MSVGDIVANVEQVDEKVGHFSLSIPDFMLDLCTNLLTMFSRHKAGCALLKQCPWLCLCRGKQDKHAHATDDITAIVRVVFICFML